MEEASRYTGSHSQSFFSLGKRDFSSSSSFSGRDGMFVAIDGGCGRGYISKIVGGTELGPLRMIMADGRKTKVSELSGLANGTIEEGTKDVLERVPQKIMEEGYEVGDPCWQSSCLAKFS